MNLNNYFNSDNTQGYTVEQLAELNRLLAIELKNQEIHSDEMTDEIRHLAERLQMRFDSELAKG